MKKINRAEFSRKILRKFFEDKSTFVQFGKIYEVPMNECPEIVLWGYASAGKIKNGIYQFSIPVEFLIELDPKNKRFNMSKQKMVFAASLFSRMGHAIAVFDWSLIVDQILLPKNGSGSVISFGVRKKRRSKYFTIKTREHKLFCLRQTEWSRVKKEKNLLV